MPVTISLYALGWVLYLIGLNLSNHQIAQELDLNGCPTNDGSTAYGNCGEKPKVRLTGEVECEMYLIAGHKAQPEVVKSKRG